MTKKQDQDKLKNKKPQQKISVDQAVFWTQEIMHSDGMDSLWDFMEVLPPIEEQEQQETEEKNNDINQPTKETD